MSYDLMVFNPAVAPPDRLAFKAWYEKVVDWPDDNSVFDPATSSADLRAWYEAMLRNWPNMQEIEDDQIDDPKVTGYSFSPHAIYIDFRWTVAEEAYVATRSLAIEHGVGFYDVSGDEGDGEIYFPGDAPRPASDGGWRQIAADFRSGDLSKYALPPEPIKRRWFDIFRRTK